MPILDNVMVKQLNVNFWSVLVFMNAIVRYIHMYIYN